MITPRAWQIGDVVRVEYAVLNNPEHSLAVVVEVYDRKLLFGGEGLGVTLIFPNGLHDGFSPDDLILFGVERIGHHLPLARYRWVSALRLREDWVSGCFDAVWRRVWV